MSADEKKFEVGDRVVWEKYSNLTEWNDDEYDDTTRGTVKKIHETGKLLVKWDDKWKTPNPSEVMPKELITEVEANEIRAKLEAEYKVWADPIKEKMEQVGKLLLEADTLATKQKKDLIEMHAIVSPLISAMSEVGWSTSSLSC